MNALLVAVDLARLLLGRIIGVVLAELLHQLTEGRVIRLGVLLVRGVADFRPHCGEKILDHQGAVNGGPQKVGVPLVEGDEAGHGGLDLVGEPVRDRGLVASPTFLVNWVKYAAASLAIFSLVPQTMSLSKKARWSFLMDVR